MRSKKTMYYNNAPKLLLEVLFFSLPLALMMGPLSTAGPFIEANTQSLELEVFSDNTFDLYTIEFGIRNVITILDVLREAHRVVPLPASSSTRSKIHHLRCTFFFPFPLPPSSRVSLVLS